MTTEKISLSMIAKDEYKCNCEHCREIHNQQKRHGEWLTSKPQHIGKYPQIKYS